MDYQDLLKRNKEFAACTQLTSLLISADVMYSTLTDEIMDILHKLDKEPNLSIEKATLGPLVHKSTILFDLIKDIKTRYNHLENGPEKPNQVKQLESELSTGIENIENL